MPSFGKVFIISCGVGENSLTPQMLQLINDTDFLIGGTRLLEMFVTNSKQTLPIKNNIKEIILILKERILTKKKIVSF
jgi:precorrin-6B methylase 1